MLVILSILISSLLFVHVSVLADQPDQARPQQLVTPKHMVLILAGTFQMGSPEGEGDSDEYPQHIVTLNAFYMDTYEVTNEQFQKFVKETHYQTTAEKEESAVGYVQDDTWAEIQGAFWERPEGKASVFDSQRANHPVVSISWQDAKAYCENVGKRLPTEAEWEYAARAGTDTKAWWGDDPPSGGRLGNFADKSHKHQFPGRPWPIVEGYDDGYARTAPVGSYDPNPWGLHDMIGNVWELVADWYAESYGVDSPISNPKGPPSGKYKVLRGGSWNDFPSTLRSANRGRGYPIRSVAYYGFRCVKDVENQ